MPSRLSVMIPPFVLVGLLAVLLVISSRRASTDQVNVSGVNGMENHADQDGKGASKSPHSEVENSGQNETSPASAAQLDQGVLSVWETTHDDPWIFRAEEPAAAFPGFEIPMSLSPDRVETVVVTSHEIGGEGEGVFYGQLAGLPGSSAVLSFVGEAQSGVVLLPEEGRSFTIHAGAGGSVRITEFDLSQSPQCGVLENDSPPVVTTASFHP